MDIYAPPAPDQEGRADQSGHQGCPGSCKVGARAAQEFVGCAGAAPARHSGLAVAPAKMSLNEGKSSAPGASGCKAMKGFTLMSFPARMEKNARYCLKITRRRFHGTNKRL